MGYKGLYNPYQYDLFSDDQDMTAPGTVNQPPDPMAMDDGTGYDFMSDVNSYVANKTSTPPFIPAGQMALPASISSPAIVNNPAAPAATSPTSPYYDKPWSNPYAGGYYGIQMDPNQMINTLTGKPDEPTTGTIGENFPQGAGKEANLDLKNNVSGPGSVGNIASEAKKKMEENIKKIAEPFTEIPEEEKCPQGQKWDPKRKQCYKETKGTFEPEANMLIAGIRGLGDLVGRKGQREEEMRFRNMTLADNFMASKPQTGFKTRGMYDVNTFGIPNAGVYATNYVQPAEQLAYRKQGGDVMYLNDKEILDIINMGGQVEFLD
jgi:hypothetical protein